MAVKAKKHIATKTASSMMGRKVIAQLLGEHGNALLGALKTASSRHQGDKRGKELKQNILILSLKANILWEDGQIKQKQLMKMVNPLNDTTLKLHDVLHSTKNSTMALDLLAAKMDNLKDLTGEILAPLMSEKNLAIYEDVAKYYSSKEFLMLLIENSEYDKEKQIVREAIGALVQPLLNKYGLEKKEDDFCDLKDCEEGIVDFQGSSFCGKHHFDMHQELVGGAPSLIHFLTNPVGKKSTVFKEISKAHFPSNSTKFFIAVENYKVCRVAVRYLFAEGMFENFLGSAANKKKVDVDAEIIKAVHVELKKHSSKPVTEFKSVEEMRRSIRQNAPTAPSIDLFNDAQAYVLKQMETVFDEQFVKTGKWTEYLDHIKLPAHQTPDQKE